MILRKNQIYSTFCEVQLKLCVDISVLKFDCLLQMGEEVIEKTANTENIGRVFGNKMLAAQAHSLVKYETLICARVLLSICLQIDCK